MQVRILLTVAKATKRALWLPREVAPEGISRRFIEVFPAQIAAAHLSVLESRYFEHAAQYVQPTRLQQKPSETRQPGTACARADARGTGRDCT
jgi:hypothetical protein